MMHRRALILDDDRQMHAVFSVLLREQGYDVIGCENAEDANNHLARLSFSVALVDIGLSGDDGLAFVRALRCDRANVNRRMPVLVVSGQNGRSIVESARDGGADAFIAKPITADTLLTALQRIARRRRPFIDAKKYCGPDRRRGRDPHYAGPERRAVNVHFL